MTLRCGNGQIESLAPVDARTPILICLLGRFQLLKSGQPVSLRGGGKAEMLLCHLALAPGFSLPRDALIVALWPESDSSLASQSLNSLIYSVHRLVGDALAGASPVLHVDGRCRLNVEAGVSVDVARFDDLVTTGERLLRAGVRHAAAESFLDAIQLYQGDLCISADVYQVVERERLRCLCLTVLARVADYHYEEGRYADCLVAAQRLLYHDPCREDAHRLVMRCCVRMGARAQAFRQYRLCEEILQTEFGAPPEPATTSLFDRIRFQPGNI